MTRPKEPEFLSQWREWVEKGPPKCCHNCEHYDQDGHCMEFDMRPPDDFAGTEDACNAWEIELPF